MADLVFLCAGWFLLRIVFSSLRRVFVGQPPQKLPPPLPVVKSVSPSSVTPSATPSGNSETPWSLVHSPAQRQFFEASKSPAPPAAVDSLTWLGPKREIQIRSSGIDLLLVSPLTYFGSAKNNDDAPEPSKIDPRLPIAPTPYVPAQRDLDYWPSYERLGAPQRRLYLDWLAGGRRALPPELGYTFLFFYGLERRALADRQDRSVVIEEVIRLRQMYDRSGQPVSRSFDTYTSSFVWFLLLRDHSPGDISHFTALARSVRAWDDDRLAYALSWLSAAGQPLPDWMAFALAGQLPRSQRSVVVKRVGNELRALFSKRYAEQFARGMTLKASKRDRRFAYRPASAALPPQEVSGPNPMGLSSQFNVLSDLWNDCIADLKRYSSEVQEAGAAAALTVDAWKAMPPELRQQVDHPLQEAMNAFVLKHTEDTTHTFVAPRALATLTGTASDAKFTASVSRRIAEVAEDLGYCVEPDPRLTGCAFEDAPVAIYLNLHDTPPDAQRYAAASTMLCVGLALAAIDGETDESELALLSQQIDAAFELSDSDERRLSTLRALRTAHPISLADLTRPFKKLPKAERERIGQFALALVAADGVVTRDELKAVRRLYAGMGLEKQEVDAVLASLMPTVRRDDEPVTIAAAVTGAPGEPIPPPPNAGEPAGLKLDRSAIAAILKDTLDVSRMLAEAMQIGCESPAASPVVATPVATTPAATDAVSFDDLPPRYAAFYKAIVVQTQWSQGDLTALAKAHDLMLAGAIEAINDWSTEKHGGLLVYEDDGRYSLEAAYLN